MAIIITYNVAERKKPYTITDEEGTSNPLKQPQLFRQLERYSRGTGISFAGDPLPSNLESQIIGHLRSHYGDRPHEHGGEPIKDKDKKKKSPKRRRYG